jgi:hypothetical protein
MQLEQLLKPHEQILPDGSYRAITGGCVAVVQHSVFEFTIRFPQGVRGFNIEDTVTVSNGKVTSAILGEGGEY